MGLNNDKTFKVFCINILLRGHCRTYASCLMASFFVFQQDGALMHREHNTVAFLERERRKRPNVV